MKRRCKYELSATIGWTAVINDLETARTSSYDAVTLSADPQYFSVMQIPLLSGRVFTEHERLENDLYIVVSKQFVDQFFPGEDPSGKHVCADWDDQAQTYEIIGEVGDKIYDITKPVKATIYFPILPCLPDLTSEVALNYVTVDRERQLKGYSRRGNLVTDQAFKVF